MPVRRLAPADAPTYRALMLDAYARHPEAFTSTVAEREPLPPAWWEARLPEGDAPGSLTVGAFDANGVLVGAAGLLFETRERWRHKATLFGMVVEPAVRGAGLGRSLVDALLAAARARPGLRTVQLTVTQGNTAAQRLYEAAGFRVFGVEPMAVAHGDGFLDKLHMACDLQAPHKSLAGGAGLARIHHAAIICSDYARSRRFYVEVLGLAVLAEHHRAARDSWKLDLALADGSQIELFSFPHPPPRPSRPEAQGLRHLAFAVADLDASLRALHAAGVETEAVRVDEYTGRRFTFFADPDGLPLELYEEPSTGLLSNR
jgi:catechol 2,3-dioxygenase-like lactoylglutathione lyase family enzyme/RimJ/RimL family protein N-acetyltransferase